KSAEYKRLYNEVRSEFLFRALEESHKESESLRDHEKMLQFRQDLDPASDLETLLPSSFEESPVLSRKHPGDEQIQAVAGEISEMKRRGIEEPRLPQPVEETPKEGRDPSPGLSNDAIISGPTVAADAAAPPIEPVKNTLVQVPPQVWKYTLTAIVVVAVVTA